SYALVVIADGRDVGRWVVGLDFPGPGEGPFRVDELYLRDQRSLVFQEVSDVVDFEIARYALADDRADHFVNRFLKVDLLGVVVGFVRRRKGRPGLVV